jgi:hypothetical protein
VRPATLATFVQEIALHHLLRREDWNLFTVFKFKSGFSSLDEGNGVARAALTLVANGAGEVIAIDVSEIV